MADRGADIAIVGAGPVGLYAAYYAGFRELSTVLLDSLPEKGGQITALYPEKFICDVAGLPSIRGRDLVENLEKQADQFPGISVLGEQVCMLEGDLESGFKLSTNRGTVIMCRSVLIAGGIGTFRPRPLSIAARYEGKGLSYFVPSIEEHTNKDVVIVGGGDSACDWALNLFDVARSITVVHRREEFRAHEYSVQQLRDADIALHTSSTIEGVYGSSVIEEVEIVHGPTQKVTVCKAQSVIAALGFTAILGPIKEWDFALQDRKIKTDSRMSTTRIGVFAAGDITEYSGKLRLISVGFGEAATAVNNAAVLLDPTRELFPGHSTDKA